MIGLDICNYLLLVLMNWCNDKVDLLFLLYPGFRMYQHIPKALQFLTVVGELVVLKEGNRIGSTCSGALI